MTVRFTKLNRRAIRKLRAGEKLIDHGIAFERLVLCKQQGNSFSPTSPYIAMVRGA